MAYSTDNPWTSPQRPRQSTSYGQCCKYFTSGCLPSKLCVAQPTYCFLTASCRPRASLHTAHYFFFARSSERAYESMGGRTPAVPADRQGVQFAALPLGQEPTVRLRHRAKDVQRQQEAIRRSLGEGLNAQTVRQFPPG